MTCVVWCVVWLQLSREWAAESAAGGAVARTVCVGGGSLTLRLRLLPPERSARRVPSAKPGALFGAKITHVAKYVSHSCVRLFKMPLLKYLPYTSRAIAHQLLPRFLLSTSYHWKLKLLFLFHKIINWKKKVQVFTYVLNKYFLPIECLIRYYKIYYIRFFNVHKIVRIDARSATSRS